ncbi:hypothetical protein PM082_018504 [Marasmius tenuissimus]|nr:hypothetical protein PM082_018504 [Marasmius tenuissimus]
MTQYNDGMGGPGHLAGTTVGGGVVSPYPLFNQSPSQHGHGSDTTHSLNTHFPPPSATFRCYWMSLESSGAHSGVSYSTNSEYSQPNSSHAGSGGGRLNVANPAGICTTPPVFSRFLRFVKSVLLADERYFEMDEKPETNVEGRFAEWAAKVTDNTAQYSADPLVLC